jgi:hypothetical protein
MRHSNLAAATLALALLGAQAQAQTAANPAARTHVRVTNGVALKYTSKLTHVVELNFTFGNTHTEGKQVITAGLDRIMKSYAMGGKDAFTIKKFTTGNSGSAAGELSNFTLADLMAGEVIVTNNISYLNQLQSKSAAQATAMETAIKTEGRGVLGFHGSGDGGGGWAFYTNDLHPVGYNGHGSRIDGSVYKFTDNAKHLILQNILETGTTPASVPMKVVGGNEVIEPNVKTRLMKNEWYKFARDLTTDATYSPRVTPLLKYDPRNLGGALEPQYRYKGGNLYTFLLKVGNGLASYVPAGHSNDELMAAGTTFDGGTGDYDRYVAQSLFFLAGYKPPEVCANNPSCNGLPIVTSTFMLTGETYTGGTAIFHGDRMAFTSLEDAPYEAKLTDVSGRVAAVKRGTGKVEYAFDQSSLKAGIYFMSVKIGKAPAKVRRFVVAQGR